MATFFLTAQSSQYGTYNCHDTEVTGPDLRDYILTNAPPCRTTVEICTAIVAACAPCLRPFFRGLLQHSSLGGKKSGYVHHGFERNERRYERPPDSKYGLELSHSGQVSCGRDAKSESQEQIVQAASGIYTSRTVSVTVE